MSLEWDARTYDYISDPMTRWGAAVVNRLRLAGNERVLDAGCGTGRVTEMLLDRLPRGQVVALDASGEMLAQARRRLEQFEGRVEFVLADLAKPVPIDAVDAILSTATFHWVHDHNALVANLASVLRPGGQLEAQCGGVGNVSSVQAVLRALGQRTDGVYFPTPDEMTQRLQTAGFQEVRAWLQPEPTPLAAGKPLESFLETVVLRSHVAHMSEAERRAFVQEVVRRLRVGGGDGGRSPAMCTPPPARAPQLPRLEIDFIRLNISARR